jgi:ABC-type multidrug transport system permease subunit
LRNFATLTRMRMQLALRNRMFFFFSVVFPLAMFFLYAGVFAKGNPRTVLYFLGPVIAFNVMGSFWGLSVALVTFREQGILRRFHVAPVSAADILASSILANFVLTLPTVSVEMFFARVLFHVPGFGNLLSLAIFVAVGTVSFASLGLVVASVTNTMQETQVINQLIWLPLIFLSGATLPLAYLPNTVQRFAVFLPATYLVSALQSALYSSSPIWKLLVQLSSLLIWALLTFFVATQLFRWEPEAKIPRRGKLFALATALPFFVFGFWENGRGSILPQAQAIFQSLGSPSNNQTQPDAKPQQKNEPF